MLVEQHLRHGACGGVQQFGVEVHKRDLFKHNGVDVRPEQLLPVTGSQQALDLICKALLDPGDSMLVESPTFLGALQTFKL